MIRPDLLEMSLSEVSKKMMKRDLLEMSLPEIKEEMLLMDEKPFRAAQIFTWLHKKRAAAISEMTDLSLDLREKLTENFMVSTPETVKKLVSSKDGTVKYLFKTADGNHIESVVTSYAHGKSQCISTQVGCKMGCKFCASGIAGFVRNLTAAEMLSEVYAAERDLGNISSIVLMGIGEPLDNFDNVIRFLMLLSDKSGRNISLRNVSLSTCGIIPKIYELAEMKTGLTLSVSLHAAYDNKRSEIMPINRTYPLGELLKACRYYTKTTGRRISFEYAVIDGVNDRREDADRLKELLRGGLFHLNLIPVNKVAENSYKTTRGNAEKFAALMNKMGINTTVRRTLGSDINAACGQLRRTYETNS
jgi:23S rRNA (adenine2503-C2)-methyltransferase